jgi:hypothetical protein
LFYFSYQEIVNFLRSLIFPCHSKKQAEKLTLLIRDFQTRFHKFCGSKYTTFLGEVKPYLRPVLFMALSRCLSSSALANPTMPLVDRKIHFAYMAAPIPKNFFKNKR